MTEDLRKVFVAAADRILPGIHGPGATAAHVLGFLEELCEEPVFRQAEVGFTSGLHLLQDLARDLYSCDFNKCSSAERDEIMVRLQAIPHPIVNRFLVQLVRITISGTLCHPVQGGNRDAVAWRALGVDFRRGPLPPRSPDEESR